MYFAHRNSTAVFPLLNGLLAFVALLSWSVFSWADNDKRCLIVASYHDEFPGQKLKVQGAWETLEGHCRIQQFDMDTKRNPDEAFGRQKALEAKALIESWRPDVVIAIDDNASRYLVKEHFKDADIPFVFSGVDWTVEEYGYPYSNATGMIEVAPVQQLVRQIVRILPNAQKGMFLRPDRFSAVKNFERAAKVYASVGIEMLDRPVSTIEDFEKAYLEGQELDFILFTNNAAIEGWNDERVKKFMLEHSKKLIVTQSDWMLPFAMLSFTKIISEQGAYAGEVAIKILEGHSPKDFPIIANRKWDMYVNEALLAKTDVELPQDLLRKAKKL